MLDVMRRGRSWWWMRYDAEGTLIQVGCVWRTKAAAIAEAERRKP